MLSIRLAYHPKTEQFLGINTFGIRLRHASFEQWLNEEVSCSNVIARLAEANFDPEFYSHYEKNIQNAWQAQH